MGVAEWLGVFAIAVALFLGAPPVFQMLLGHPKITFNFTRLESEKDTLLLAHLYNFPVTNRALSRIGVRREDAHFHVGIIIKDQSGNMRLHFTEPPPGSGNPFEQNLCHLHPGQSPKTLEILGADGLHARTYYENKPTSFQEFEAGNYSVRIEVWVGERMFFEERAFVITKDLRKSYWADA